jgi:integration host factor subunit alpha
MVIILLSWGANISLSCNVRRVFMTLTKADIAKKIADDCGFMKIEATEILEKLLHIIKANLISGEDIMISGFGKWFVRSKHARRGINPKTGKPMVLDARRVVTWKYSPVLKKVCNE